MLPGGCRVESSWWTWVDLRLSPDFWPIGPRSDACTRSHVVERERRMACSIPPGELANLIRLPRRALMESSTQRALASSHGHARFRLAERAGCMARAAELVSPASASSLQICHFSSPSCSSSTTLPSTHQPPSPSPAFNTNTTTRPVHSVASQTSRGIGHLPSDCRTKRLVLPPLRFHLATHNRLSYRLILSR